MPGAAGVACVMGKDGNQRTFLALWLSSLRLWFGLPMPPFTTALLVAAFIYIYTYCLVCGCLCCGVLQHLARMCINKTRVVYRFISFCSSQRPTKHQAFSLCQSPGVSSPSLFWRRQLWHPSRTLAWPLRIAILLWTHNSGIAKS